LLKKLFTLSSALVFACSLSMPAFAQGASKSAEGKESPAPGKAEKTAKQARWEGIVIRTNKDQSTITVRKVEPSVERDIHYDSSTRFTSQEHASKKVNDIDASQIKEEDRVICLGTYDPKGNFQATLISKRLSHSPK
jgi:hypothetical protein